MAKFTDAVEATMVSYFEINDQPTQAQFTALMAAIQAGIDEHDHKGVAAGDGMQLDWDDIWGDAVHDHSAAGEGGTTLGPLADAWLEDGAQVGIAGNERLVFNAAGYVSVMGAYLGIATLTPTAVFDVAHGGMSAVLGADLNVTTRTDATTKYSRVGGFHYTNVEEPVGMIMHASLVGTNIVYIGGGSGSFNAATSVQFYTAANNTTVTGTQRMRIDAAGDVSIISLGGGGNQDVGADNTGKLYVPFVSDRKFKNGIKPLTGGLEAVLGLRGVTFKWNKKSLAKVGLDFGEFGLQVGLVAQEVETTIPLAVSDGAKYKSYDSRKITPYIIEAIKELANRVEALEEGTHG